MKRSILGLLYLIQGMRQVGIDVDTRLESIGLQANALDPSAIIHPDLEWDILQVIAKDISPELGLKIGQHYALAGYGPMLMLLVTSPTAEIAVKNGIYYQGLTHLSGVLGLAMSSEMVALTYKPVSMETSLGLLRAQCEISGTYKFIQDVYKMVGLVMPEIQVELPFKKPTDVDVLNQYYDYYGRNLNFDMSYASFGFEPEILKLKIPSADAITFNIYKAKCELEVQRLGNENLNKGSLIERVNDYLEMQKGFIPTMAETANALNIPERTLRYQLQQLNTSYKEIREQLIKDKALRFIEYKEYSIEVIAEMLGYSEPAAFNHAFKRWFGQSPRQYGK